MLWSISPQNQLPVNMGTGIKSRDAAKSEKKANAIMSFTFICPHVKNFGFNLVFVFFQDVSAAIGLAV
jgi:hypothetical protein